MITDLKTGTFIFEDAMRTERNISTPTKSFDVGFNGGTVSFRTNDLANLLTQDAFGPSGNSADVARFLAPAIDVPTNPELLSFIKAQQSGAPINGLINLLNLLLNDPAILEAAAAEALREGRAGKVSTNPKPSEINAALDKSWTPAPAPATAGVVPMSQLDYNEKLGAGNLTIRKAGCFLTSLTMAATKITGQTDLDPAKASRLIKDKGGFVGSNLRSDRAADALGMKIVSRSAISPSNASKKLTEVDQSLADGRPVVAGVDYKTGQSSAFSKADHFITIVGKNADGTYKAIDPAGGKEITLTRGSDGMLRGGKYTVREAVILEKA